ncbi:MAG: growth inhibitor [Halonotius sp. J07HN4]|jgi:Growth inhibitor|nr:MAG: growth inhibitor [Halonotius sp. J07HN4]
MKLHRGDIVTVQLNPTEGSEQRGANRPCVIIQNDVGNEHSPTTIVAPFTTQYDSNDTYPFEVELLASETPLNGDSVADLSQIRVVDIGARIQQRLGSVPTEKLREIDVAIKESLGLY